VRVAHHAPGSAVAVDDQGLAFERIQGVLNLALSDVHRRLAAALLIAAGDERIEGERVVVGRGELLLDQHREDARLQRREDG
jgi:hypothetical protein